MIGNGYDQGAAVLDAHRVAASSQIAEDLAPMLDECALWAGFFEFVFL